MNNFKRKLKTILKTMIPLKYQPRLKSIFSFPRTAYNKIYYFGLQFKCPLCNSSLKKFHPSGFTVPVIEEKQITGAGFSFNGSCPVCHSGNRCRLLYLYLYYKTNLFNQNIKLLHVAPEYKLMSILFKQNNIDYLTADLYAENVMVKMDITNIQYPNNSFDAIICNHVLEHVIDDHKAMSELYRVLRPGGWAVLQVPISLLLKETYEDFSIISPLERERAFGQNDHVRIYAKDYKKRLEEIGFKVKVFKWIEDNTFGGLENKYGLSETESVYFVTKNGVNK